MFKVGDKVKFVDDAFEGDSRKYGDLRYFPEISKLSISECTTSVFVVVDYNGVGVKLRHNGKAIPWWIVHRAFVVHHEDWLDDVPLE